jgi:serine/threonine protein phosphatase PrpC
MLEMMATGRTDVGSVRTNNEDSYCVDAELGLFMVADGMGGHVSGEVASQMAVEFVLDTYAKALRRKGVPLVDKYDPHLSVVENRLLSCIHSANRAIYELSRKETRYHGMGTTLVGLLAQEDHLMQFHVGDSRVYRLRSGEFRQLSEDHSLVAEQVKLGLLTESEARTSRAKNVITRALGVHKTVEVDVRQHEWAEGDLYLLCSDGLSDNLTSQEMRDILLRHTGDLEASIHQLIQTALEYRASDNVTAVLLKLGRMRTKSHRLRGTLERILKFHADS